MSGFDLHTHSTNSDGVFAPAEVVRRAAQAGLEGIALSDHDSTAGLPEARAEAATAGIEVLDACEISAGWRGVSVHMLGYFFDVNHPRIVEELRWIRDDRVVRAEKMVEKLRELGVDITVEQVRAHAGGESIGRPHVAMAMVDAGAIANTVEAFTSEWIGDDGRAYVHKRALTPQETVTLVKEAGGVTVIAHPIWVEKDLGDAAAVEELVEELAALGLAGLEVDHPDHEAPWRQRFGALADRLGLLKTGSSDYHGNLHGGHLGIDRTPREVVEALRLRRP